MNTKEFAVFADRIKTAYPKDNLLATGDQMDWWYSFSGCYNGSQEIRTV